MTAGLDLALAMVEKDLGAEAARSVAHKLVMQQRRAGGQSQHSEMLDLAPKSDRIQNALNYARQNLGRALTVEALADAVHLSRGSSAACSRSKPGSRRRRRSSGCGSRPRG
jgi:transcriptional regulator GlxA family with amidase domain